MRYLVTNESVVAHWYNADTLTASPSQINFLIFVPLFSFLSVVYLEVVPRFMPKGKSLLPSSKHKLIL